MYKKSCVADLQDYGMTSKIPFICNFLLWAEAHTKTKRQATRQGYLPSLLGEGDKGIKIVYGEEKILCTGPTIDQPRQNKNLLYQQDKPNKPTKEGTPLSLCLPYSINQEWLEKPHWLSLCLWLTLFIVLGSLPDRYLSLIFWIYRKSH